MHAFEQNSKTTHGLKSTLRVVHVLPMHQSSQHESNKKTILFRTHVTMPLITHTCFWDLSDTKVSHTNTTVTLYKSLFTSLSQTSQHTQQLCQQPAEQTCSRVCTKLTKALQVYKNIAHFPFTCTITLKN